MYNHSISAISNSHYPIITHFLQVFSQKVGQSLFPNHPFSLILRHFLELTKCPQRLTDFLFCYYCTDTYSKHFLCDISVSFFYLTPDTPQGTVQSTQCTLPHLFHLPLPPAYAYSAAESTLTPSEHPD